MKPPPPEPPPVPQAFPIRLDADHAYEVASNLRLLEHELAQTKTRPTSWRWVIVAAYKALGHALAMRHPRPPENPLRHLVELFGAMVEERPDFAKARSAVEQLELLRTSFLSTSAHNWPVSRSELEVLAGTWKVQIRDLMEQDR